MTNIRFTKKSRHPRRNNGGVSPGKKQDRDGKLFNEFTGKNYFEEEKKDYNDNGKKWLQLNFKY
jgi:hypothetical protein